MVNGCSVLILVVVEDVLVLLHLWCKDRSSCSLNPCCGGRCSSTGRSTCIGKLLSVLILVVVEDVIVLAAVASAVVVASQS